MASQQNAAADALHRLFRRCVECPPEQPSCPPCKDDETCSLLSRSCDTCASMTCVKIGEFPGAQPSPKKSMPVGAIAGGVVGGVAAVILVLALLWFFCIRPKRRQLAAAQMEKRDQAGLTRTGSRAQSIASTVLTRASNVIQIAYIPGVTGRSPPESPGIPPPMPNLGSTANSTPNVEQHFFMPKDLRDSTCSDNSSLDPRVSLAPSLARASVATTIYRNDAIVPPIPAQPAFRGQANIVKVKTGSPGSTTPRVSTTPVPNMPKALNMNNSSIVARNMVARPIEVKKAASGSRVPTLGNLAKANSNKSTAAATSSPNTVVTPVSDEKEVLITPVIEIQSTTSTPDLSRRNEASVLSLDTTSMSGVSAVLPSDGPLSGSGSDRSTLQQRTRDSGGLTAMIEDAIKNASSHAVSPRPEARRHDSGPFSDSNELKQHSP